VVRTLGRGGPEALASSASATAITRQSPHIVKRTHEGRQIARANGVKMGRRPKLNSYQTKEARQRLAKGEKPRDLAKAYAVSLRTIWRLGA
jgi:DNA invertase Pin-like site-specific DNA recombinase